MAKKTYDKAFLGDMYKKMQSARKFEERVQWLFAQGMVHGTTHLGIGEEATAVGTIMALGENDYVFGTHRGHNQGLTKGLDVNEMMAEILARKTGCCGGVGGSMHIADPTKRYFGADGVLGASAVMANGVALAIKKEGRKDEIVNLFFGDGTFNQGGTLEALNLAGIWKLPTLFVCVNNTYGMSTHISRVTAETDLAKRGPAFGVPSINVDGNDVLAVYEAVKKAREHVLTEGPMLIVENTYRISGHSKSDGNLYRTKEEIESWKQKCPIKRFAKYLTENGYFTEEELQKIADEAQAEIDAATEFAKASPEPDMAVALDSVYVK